MLFFLFFSKGDGSLYSFLERSERNGYKNEKKSDLVQYLNRLI